MNDISLYILLCATIALLIVYAIACAVLAHRLSKREKIIKELMNKNFDSNSQIFQLKAALNSLQNKLYLLPQAEKALKEKHYKQFEKDLDLRRLEFCVKVNPSHLGHMAGVQYQREMLLGMAQGDFFKQMLEQGLVNYTPIPTNQEWSHWEFKAMIIVCKLNGIK